MPQGYFFVIDGPDGAGKGTQIELLKGALPGRHGRPLQDFVFTREPGGSPFAEEIRKLILSPAAKEASGTVMIQLFGAARFDHLERVIAPALAAGKVVVTDRFDAATFAYQIMAQAGGDEASALFVRQREVIERRLFHLTRNHWEVIILDVPAEVGMGRSRARRGQEHTHFDGRDTAFHEAVRAGYRRYHDRYSFSTRVIDASRTTEEVHSDVLAVFDQVLRKQA